MKSIYPDNSSFGLYLNAKDLCRSLFEHRTEKMAEFCSIGSTKVYDYNPAENSNEIMLFIPSIINRFYILDLLPDNSLIEFCVTNKKRVLAISWDNPVGEEMSYNMTDYIIKRVIPIIQKIHHETGKKVTLCGYCLGGLMAIAAAITCKDAVKKLVLLATPWDFSATILSTIMPSHNEASAVINLIHSVKKIPKEIISNVFYLYDPDQIYKKYINFSNMESRSKESKLFIAVEEWLENGLDVTSESVREILYDFGFANKANNNNWLVDNNEILLSKINIPTLIFMPQKDKIVPLKSMKPLSEIEKSLIVECDCGHVGMIIGSKAKKQVWQPLLEWLS
jgi:polyhydroxyalkanoate synthase subunit PhaC